MRTIICVAILGLLGCGRPEPGKPIYMVTTKDAAGKRIFVVDTRWK